MNLLEKIPEIFQQFIIVLLLSLLIGLEQRRVQSEKEKESVPFGTDRTFAFIGVLGFMLYVLDPHNFIPFTTGAVLLGIIFGIYYYKKIQMYNTFGTTKILVALITYTLGPILLTQPRWVSILIVVSVLILVESKTYFIKFSGKLTNNEFITFAKFLIISGVILPILPTTPISDTFIISPYQIWLSLVVVSGISYFSYLLQKFILKKSGVIVSGLLGGLYSSTATTIVLSRKSKEHTASAKSYGSSIILASSMMYLRVVLLMFIFNYQLGIFMLPYFIVMIAVSLAIGLIFYFIKGKSEQIKGPAINEKNPLELKIAVIFAALFLLFSFLTSYTLRNFGESGLNTLSYIVGFADIDPFLLNLFQGKFQIDIKFIAQITFQAIISNNILKIVCSMILANKDAKKIVLAGLGIITLVNIVIIFFFL